MMVIDRLNLLEDDKSRVDIRDDDVKEEEDEDEDEDEAEAEEEKM
jgi:hypothetical protein